MKLTMLGTGNAAALECYNTCFAIREKDDVFLVDAGGGNGILRQLRLAGIDIRDIRDIFVTHKHTDHIVGMIWILRILCKTQRPAIQTTPVKIYGHDEVIQALKGFAGLLFTESEQERIARQVSFVEARDEDTLEILNRKVTFFDIHSSKQKQFGFCMYLTDDEKLVCCGDEPFEKHEEKYAHHCKWLLHEAFCLHDHIQQFHPYEKHHSTVKDACETAEALRVENLVLYHTEDRIIRHRKRLYTEEGQRYFSGNLFVPEDLEELEL